MHSPTWEVLSIEKGAQRKMSRIKKAMEAFITLKNIGKPGQVKTGTKKSIFNTNVKTVLLYGSETWRTTKATCKSLQVFINRCLRRNLRLQWSGNIWGKDQDNDRWNKN
jgi:hypothetical protein